MQLCPQLPEYSPQHDPVTNPLLQSLDVDVTQSVPLIADILTSNTAHWRVTI